jgi:hypothetical protein
MQQPVQKVAEQFGNQNCGDRPGGDCERLCHAMETRGMRQRHASGKERHRTMS